MSGYTKVDPDSMMDIADDLGAKKSVMDAVEQAKRNIGEYVIPKLTDLVDGTEEDRRLPACGGPFVQGRGRRTGAEVIGRL